MERWRLATIYFLAVRQHSARMTKPPSDLAEKIVVRLPNGMRDRLADVARANGRSVNAEVVARLTLTFETVGDLSVLGAHAFVSRLEANAEATEYTARRLFYELALLTGGDISEKENLGAAIDAYIAETDDRQVRHQAVRTILEAWLTEHGFLQRPTSAKEG